jgi:hypothetical protein
VSFSDEERAELIAALSRTAEMVGLLLDALDVLMLSRLSEEHGDDTKRDERHSAEHHEPFEHHAAKWRKSHGTGALDGSTLDRHPHKTASLTAPVLDASRNRKVVQLNFAHADRLMAARTMESLRRETTIDQSDRATA